MRAHGILLGIIATIIIVTSSTALYLQDQNEGADPGVNGSGDGASPPYSGDPDGDGGTGPDEGGIRFDFDVGPCDHNCSMCNCVKHVLWEDNSNVTVIVNVAINCAQTIGNVSYSVNGTRVDLQYSEDGELSANCICPHIITYRFENIEKRDYSCNLKRL